MLSQKELQQAAHGSKTPPRHWVESGNLAVYNGLKVSREVVAQLTASKRLLLLFVSAFVSALSAFVSPAHKASLDTGALRLLVGLESLVARITQVAGTSAILLEQEQALFTNLCDAVVSRKAVPTGAAVQARQWRRRRQQPQQRVCVTCMDVGAGGAIHHGAH